MKKILFFVLLIFMMCNVTKANETTLIKDKFDNTHTYYYDSNQGRYRYLLTSKYIFEDSVAYCIELGKPIDSFNYVFSSSFDGSNLSKEDIDYIKLAAYYGYNYPGHESDNYYLATQDIIWKRLSNVSVKYIRNMNPNNYIDVSKEKEDILLIEGIHCLNPTILENIDSSKKFKIYLSALTEINIDEDNRISTTDNRLIRRMIRDYYTRGYAPDDTLEVWKNVRLGEEKYIFPNLLNLTPTIFFIYYVLSISEINNMY